MSPIIIAALGLAVVATLIVVFLLATPSTKLAMERRRPERAAQPTVLTKLSGKILESLDQALASRGGGLDQELEQAGLKRPAKEFVFFVIVASVVLFSAGFLFGNVVAAFLLAAVPPVGAKVLLGVLKGRRIKKFSKQLDEVTQQIASSMRAGHSFNQSVEQIASTADDPVREEFARVSMEVRLGTSIGDALSDCAVRMGSEDLEWIAQAVAINREVGGNLADVIDNVGKLIRGRAELHRKVAALSAEGKMSAYILIALPIVVGVFVAYSNPGYLNVFFESIIGMVLFGVAVVMLVGGAFWLRATVKIKY